MCGYECVDIFSRRLDESDINFIPQIFAREKKTEHFICISVR